MGPQEGAHGIFVGQEPIEVDAVADLPTPLTPRTSHPSLPEDDEVFAEASPGPFKRQYSWALASADDLSSSCRLYAWGRNDTGQLGNGSETAEAGPDPTEVVSGRDIVAVAGSTFNTAFVTGDGDLFTCGSNDAGQLGSRKGVGAATASRVEALDAFNVQHVACGESHMLAIVDNGNLASWGSSDFGQLGQGEEATAASHPRIVKAPREHFVRVSAGGNHSLALTGSGQVFSFGDGSFGALGHGDVRNRASPMLITRLWPLGVTQIACGDSHSCALAHDGRIFCWGRGKYGQIGQGSFDNATLPHHVRVAFPGQQVACGGDHTVMLAKSGELLSWGRGTWGQTGHGATDNISRPRLIQGLEDHTITQVSAGARHTIALSKTAVFGWGLASEGQLGSDASEPVLSPRHIRGIPLQPPLLYMQAVGDHCLAVAGDCRKLSRTATGSSMREHGVGLRPLVLPHLLEMAQRAINVATGKPEMQKLIWAVEDMFASPAFLAAQMGAQAATPERKGNLSEGNLHIDIRSVDQLYTALLKLYNTDLVRALGSASERLAMRVREAITDAQSPALANPHLLEHTWARTLFILLQSPLNSEPTGIGRSLMGHIAHAAASISQQDKHVLTAAMTQLPAEVLAARNVRPVHNYLNHLAQRQSPRSELLCGVHLLMLMFLANKAGPNSPMIPNAEFYNAAVSDSVPLEEDFIIWFQHQQRAGKRKPGPKAAGLTELVSLCQVPFVLTPKAKARVLQTEATLQKQEQMRAGSMQAVMAGMHPSMAAFLGIQVRRDHVLEDALNQIVHRPNELKKPLRVAFAGEEGVDQGGVTKEFFQLLTKAIFNEAYGMFKYDQQTRTFWFNWTSMEADLEFCLVGMVLGLAIYNGVILDVHFPLVVYKKLLGRPVDFQDLRQGMPELAKGLEQLLQFKGDVESTFALSFEVEYDYFGEMRSHELRPGGSKEPVTAASRQEYVRLYTEWVLNDSISRQFTAFARGFHQVCGGYALTLFRHEELELLVCGLPHLDFEALQRAARYEAGFHAQHPTIHSLWRVIHGFTLEQKKRFLFFTTGCDRAPVGGLQELVLIIQRSGPDTDRLPTSHTCFNVMLLPEYSGEAKLRTCLTTAIENAEGFGLQ